MATATSEGTPTQTFPCTKDGCDRVFENVQGRNMHITMGHNRAKHHRNPESNVVSKNKRGPYNMKGKTGAPVVQQSLQISRDIVEKIKTQIKTPREKSNVSKQEISTEILAYTVGKIESICEGIARSNDLPAKLFTLRVSEYLLLTSRR